MIKVTIDDKRVRRQIERLKNGVATVASNTVNTTLFELKEIYAPDEFAKQLDRPTPFTQNSTAVRKASLRKVRGEIFIMPIAERYLLRQIYGRAEAVPIPTKLAKLTKFGNIRGLRSGLTRRLEARGGVSLGRRGTTIQATVGGLPGIWKATPTGLDPIIVFPGPTRVRPRLNFQRGMKKWADRRIPRNFQKEAQRLISKIL